MKKPIRSLLTTIHSGLRTIRKAIRTLRSHVPTITYDLDTQFHIATAIRTFVCWAWRQKGEFAIRLTATMLGVYAGYVLANHAHQGQLNALTNHRLHLVVLESQFNISTLLEVSEAFSKDTANTVMIKRIDTPSAIAAINDPNIVSVLPADELQLLAAYIDAHAKLDHALELHNDYLLRTSQQSPNNQAAFAQNIRYNAAAATSTCYYVQQRFVRYFDEGADDDYQRLQSLRQEIHEMRTGVLSGTIQINLDVR